MKQIFAVCAVLFLAMYLFAQGTVENTEKPGVVRLRWATDANPARTVQTGLFDRLHPGLSVLVDPNPAGDPSKQIVQCATGTGPDLMDMGPESMQTLVSAGMLLDLTPYAAKMGFDTARTYPAIGESLKVEGKQYTFPCNVSTNAVLYNKQIFDDHGVPYPKPDWTYDDFIRTSKLIQERPSRSGQKHLAVAHWLNTWFFGDLLVGHGGRNFTPDGLHSALDSPEALATMQDYFRMMHVEHVLPTPADAAAMSSHGGWGAGGLNWFSEGKAAMIFIGRWYIVQVPNFPALKGNLAAVPLPRVGSRSSSGVAFTRAAGINIKSPRRQEALRFLQYLASPEYGRVIVEDGDALPPNPHVAETGGMLVNEMVPDAGFHQVFIDAIRNARSLDFSPFIDASEMTRWIKEFLEKVENRLLPPDQALHALATQIDERIRMNLERRPDLQKKYTQVTGKSYRPDWWRGG